MVKARAASAEEKQSLGLDFRIYVPESLGSPSEASGLVFLVHGRAGNYDVMWVFARPPSVGEKVVFIAPQAPIADSIGGFSWWNVEGRGGGVATAEEMEKASGRLESFVRDSKSHFGFTPSITTVAAGFSQGAGTVCSLAFRNPEVFSSVGLLAGFVPQVEREIPSKSRSSLSLPNFFIASGTEDKIIPIETARKGRDYLQSCGATVSYREDPVGHKVSSDGIKALNSWLASELGPVS